MIARPSTGSFRVSSDEWRAVPGFCRTLWLLGQCAVLDQSKRGPQWYWGDSWSRERLSGGVEGMAVAKCRGEDTGDGVWALHLAPAIYSILGAGHKFR